MFNLVGSLYRSVKGWGTPTATEVGSSDCRPRLGCEPLEDRMTPSASLQWYPGTGLLRVQLYPADIMAGATFIPQINDDNTLSGFTDEDGDVLLTRTIPCWRVRSIVVVGTNNDDTIDLSPITGAKFAGVNGHVWVYGRAGDDKIDGSGYNDKIYGDSGKDQLIGNNGNDVLWGGTGDNELYGNNGNDVLWGGTGHDYMSGGYGNDVLRGGAGNDDLKGGDGNDVLLGGADSDCLYGEAGNDWLFGENGDDHLFGGDGNDALSGGLRRGEMDEMCGGDGIDRWIWHPYLGQPRGLAGFQAGVDFGDGTIEWPTRV